MTSEPPHYEVRTLPDRRPLWRRAWRPLALAIAVSLAAFAAFSSWAPLVGGAL